ncbi:hypothetical protein QJS66_15770 [Kocuria rhizophila]|nr:hypothetical protein QJS66_15770 [Kocuria rhizophila]
MVRLSGEITEEIEAVFAVDWYSETNERLMADVRPRTRPCR